MIQKVLWYFLMNIIKKILVKYKDTVIPHKKSASSETFLINAFMKNKWVASPLNMLSAAQIAEYRDKRLLSVKPSTISREFGIVKHALHVAKLEWDWDVPIDLFAGIRLPQIQQRAVRRINDHDFKTLLEEASKHSNMYLKPIILIAINTAMRRGEILSLEWINIDFERARALLPMTKNGRSRWVPLSKKALLILDQVPRTSNLVFPVSEVAVRQAWERLRKRSGLMDLNFHDLRHEAISRMFEKGLNVPQVASISGHRTASQLFRYVQIMFLKRLKNNLRLKLRGSRNYKVCKK